MVDSQRHGHHLYATISCSFIPNMSRSGKINANEEVNIADSAAEYDLINSLAEIYSIIRTLDGRKVSFAIGCHSVNQSGSQSGF